MTELIKIPVEYTLITTSDWTQFSIIEGGLWEFFSAECLTGAENLKKEISYTAKELHIEKNSFDETPVIVKAKGFLKIKKETPHPEIKYKISKGDIQATTVIVSVNGRLLTALMNNGSVDFDDKNPKEFRFPYQSHMRNLTKQKIFIIYGREEIQALRLKDFLRKFNVDAITLQDIKDNGKTIFQKLDDVQNQIDYAIAILTPDDVGCLKSNFETIETGRKTYPKENLFKVLTSRARQNVLLELGLFIGALGRENICYLKQKDLKEIPSDLNGVMYKEFEKSVEETFHKLQEELFPLT